MFARNASNFPSGDHEGLLPPSRRLICVPGAASEWIVTPPATSNAASARSGLTSTAPIVFTEYASSSVGNRVVLVDARTPLLCGSACVRVGSGALARLTTVTIRTSNCFMTLPQETGATETKAAGLSAVRQP